MWRHRGVYYGGAGCLQHSVYLEERGESIAVPGISTLSAELLLCLLQGGVPLHARQLVGWFLSLSLSLSLSFSLSPLFCLPLSYLLFLVLWSTDPRFGLDMPLKSLEVKEVIS